MWPFVARCKNCGSKVRLKIPRWKNVVFQILGQVAFWGILLMGIVSSTHNLIVAAISGAFIAIIISIIPGIFAELEVSQ
jgi:hypothetical protein